MAPVVVSSTLPSTVAPRPVRLHKLTSSLYDDLQSTLEAKKVLRKFWSQFWDMCRYLVFLGVFTAVVLGTRDSIYSFRFNDAVKDFILNEEFPEREILKNFYDIRRYTHFWEWTETVFLPQLFKNTGGFGASYIYEQNLLLGALRLRQGRVKPGSNCRPMAPFDRIFTDQQCWPQYTVGSSDISKAPYGPNGTFVYRTSVQLGSGPQIARLQVYDGGGYAEDFPLWQNLNDHIEHLRYLRENEWIDLATRVVFMDFTIYNANLNLFQVSQVAFEFMPSGGIFPSATFRTARLIKYTRGIDGTTQFFLEILLAMMVLGYFLEELIELYNAGLWDFLRNGWNLMDFINMILFIAAGAVRAAVMQKLSDMQLDPAEAIVSGRFYNFQTISILNTSELNLLATNALLLWFKVYKYASFLPSFAMVTATIARSVRNAFGFVAIVILVLFGFSQSGVLLWGNDLDSFRTFIDSFLTLLRLLLGDFDYVSMKYSNRVIGPMYFVSFLVTVNFIMLNMFLAILDEAYQDVQLETESQNKMTIVDIVRSWLLRKRSAVAKIRMRLESAVNNENFVRSADANQDHVLDMDELRFIFDRYKDIAESAMGIHSAEELMAQFDVDNNNLLDAREQERLLNELEKWSAAAEAERRALVLSQDVNTAIQHQPHTHGAHVSSANAQFVSGVKVDLAMYFKHLSDMEKQIAKVCAALGIAPII